MSLGYFRKKYLLQICRKSKKITDIVSEKTKHSKCVLGIRICTHLIGPSLYIKKLTLLVEICLHNLTETRTVYSAKEVLALKCGSLADDLPVVWVKHVSCVTGRQT